MNYNKKRQGKSLYKDKEVNPERRDSIWITFQERLCDGSKKKSQHLKNLSILTISSEHNVFNIKISSKKSFGNHMKIKQFILLETMEHSCTYLQ